MLRIAILDPMGVEYDENTLEERGLGGSESAVILLSRELSKVGFEVSVFNTPTEKSKLFRTIEDFKLSKEHFDILVSVRSVVPFYDESYREAIVNCKHKVVWAHDTFLDGDTYLQHLITSGIINEIFTLSDFHTSYLTNCNHGSRRMFEVLKKHIWQTRNGVNEFKITKQKDKNLFVYNASYSKGMECLVKNIWPRVKQKIPDAKLKVIGGYYELPSGPDEQQLSWKELSKHTENDVSFTGVITQREVVEMVSEASFMIYPCTYPETFGISSLESLYYNTPILTCNFGALEEVALDSCSYKIDYPIEPNSLYPNIDKEQQVDKFVEMVIEAYCDEYLYQQKMNACNIVKDIVSWSGIALQWKQHFYKKLGRYMTVEEYREVDALNKRVREVFGTRFQNPESIDVPKNPQQRLRIIVPVRNAENYITKCLESIVAQDYDNYTVHIIDDSSTDQTKFRINKFLECLPDELKERIFLKTNNYNWGALYNQYITLTYNKDILPEDIAILVDGDDWLVNDPNIFHKINNLYHAGAEMTYGSCYSLCDDIPLIAQKYPEGTKNFKEYKFPWIMPYTHMRTFRKSLFDKIEDSSLKDENGDCFMAGGDLALFYELIEHADPTKVVAVPDVMYVYNDLNPLNDFKVNSKQQDETKRKVMNRNNNVDYMSYVTSASYDIMKKEYDIAPAFTSSNIDIPPDKRILIAVPTDHGIHPETFKSIYSLKIPSGYKADFQYFYGYCVDQVRNLVVNYTLQHNYDYLFFVDHDITFEPDALERLLQSNVPIVGGLYRQRKEEQILEAYYDNYTNIPVEHLDLSSVGKYSAKTFPAGAIGMGCCLIKAEVLRGIEYPHFFYKSAIDHKDTFSEDIYFCKKAKEVGYRPYFNVGVMCGHIGEQVFRIKP